MELIVKITIGIILISILFNLFKAMKVMLKEDPEQTMSHFIGKRLKYSVLLILILLLCLAFGVIQPNPRPY